MSWTLEEVQKIHDIILSIYHNKATYPNNESYWNAIKNVFHVHTVPKGNTVKPVVAVSKPVEPSVPNKAEIQDVTKQKVIKK